MDIREEPYTEMQIVDLPDQELAVVSHRGVTLDDLTRLFDSAMAPLQAAMASGAFHATGPFLAAYSGTVTAPFDIAIGFPAEDLTLDSAGEVTRYVFTGGPTAVYTHLGTYDRLGDSWATFMAAIERSGRTPSDQFMEVYVSEPGVVPDEELRTDLLILLRD